MASDGPLPFEVSFNRLSDDIDEYIGRVFAALESDFLVMPRGVGFIAFDSFAEGYHALYKATDGFKHMDVDRLFEAVCRVPLGLVVLRTILGLSPPEWSDLATLMTGVSMGQGSVRTLDRAIRKDPTADIGHTPVQEERIRALVQTACKMLTTPPPDVGADRIHRLDKIDSFAGMKSLMAVASDGVAYPTLLYERFLGRPFASHRDSVSELVGGALEDKIEQQLVNSGVPFVRATRAEAIDGWEQNPDFFCPNPVSPIAVIEAKMTQDDGTARDKAARVLRLAAMRDRREQEGQVGFDVIACIAGRGFGVRKSDMKSLLLATRGLVFTMSQLDHLPTRTRLRRYT